MTNPAQWRGMKYPNSEVVGLTYRYALPGKHVEHQSPLAIDVGCGSGRHLRFLEEVGYRANGIDPDQEMVDTARSNGVTAIQASVTDYEPPESPSLVLCWGLMMLIEDAPSLIAKWQPELIIADWRTPNNTCFKWPENEFHPNAAITMHQHDHILDGQTYFAHDLRACTVPGYERIHWQRLTKEDSNETNEWIQTVHQRRQK